MAEREALALNESTPQILAPQSGDTYLLPRSFRCVGDGIFTANATSATSTRSSDAAAYTYLVRGGHAYAQAATNTTGADLTLAGGIGRRFYTITDYTAMAGSVFTLVINGTTSTKTEGVDFNAVTTNNQTATNLATAIDAISGVSAVAVSGVCYVTPDDSTYSLTIYENASGATSTSGASGIVKVSSLAVGYDLMVDYGYGYLSTNAGEYSLIGGGGAGTPAVIAGEAMSIAWGPIAGFWNNWTLTLFRDANDTLAQRRGTNAQTSRIYQTYTDVSNYERLTLKGTAGSYVELAAETAGTGADNLDLYLTPAGTGMVYFNNAQDAAGVGAGTISNAPVAGNPAKWLKVKIGATAYAIPAWALV